MNNPLISGRRAAAKRRRSAFLLVLALCVCAGCHPSSPAATTRPGPAPPAAGPTLKFRDVAAAAGLRYRWTLPPKRPLTILQTIGNGCAFLDYDNDGNLDVLLVGPKLALYKGDGRGHFTDVTHETGLDAFHGDFLGCAVGDYDNDGYDDIYISGYRTGLLLHNDHAKRFTDVTKAMGLMPQPWGTSAAFGDYDGDGFLDLYVCDYIDFGPQTKPQYCSMEMLTGKMGLTGCGPESYVPIKGVFFHNLHGRRFQDVTQAVGGRDTPGASLGASWADYDGSGHLSLTVANDEQPGDLFQNDGRGHFKNVGQAAGVAFGNAEREHGGMGVDWGDYDNDGRLDLFVATFFNEADELYRNMGNGLFSNVNYTVGIGQVTTPPVGFGAKFFDADNDGWLDLIVANGHTEDNVAQYKLLHGAATFRQPTLLFRNRGGRAPTFDDQSRSAGPDLQRPIVGRGLAIGDYDNDGRVDVLIVDSDGHPLLLHNETPQTGHWLEVRLVGTRSNRDAYGAVVWLQARGGKLMRYCHTDGSYLSASDRRVHFGVARATQVTVTVQWPSGGKDVFPDLATDRVVTLREGTGTHPAPGG